MISFKAIRKLFAVILTVSCVACAVQPLQLKIKSSRALYDSQFEQQIQLLENQEQRFSQKNRLLWLMNLCAVSQYAYQFKTSNKYCQQSEALLKQRQTGSVSENMHAYLTDSNAISYSGETHEHHLLYALGMINYAALHNQSEALVESRRLDITTRARLDKAISQEEALGRYLSGLLYESEGNIDSALIDYRIAFHGYLQNHDKLGLPFPSSVGNDLLQAFTRMGMQNEKDRYKKRYALFETNAALNRENGEIVIIAETGYAPYRATEFYTDGGKIIPLGVYKRRPAQVHKIMAKPLGQKEYQSATKVYDSALTIKQLQSKLEYEEILKNELRRLQISDFKKYGGEFDDFDPASTQEMADVRSWSTIPGTIQLLRFSLPAGRHTVTVKYYSYYGEAVYKQLLSNIVVKANKRTFLFTRVP